MVTPRSRMLADDADHVLDLGRIETGQHFVEQQEPRPRGERAGQFEALLARDGQVAAPARRRGRRGRRTAHRLARRLAGAMQRQVLAAETGADRAVVEHRHVGERLHDLVRAGEPGARDACRASRR